jgi:hypothetical protein
VICTALAVIFIINFGYFTGFPWTDYQQMVAPSYLVFAIWIGCGIEFGSCMVARAFSVTLLRAAGFSPRGCPQSDPLRRPAASEHESEKCSKLVLASTRVIVPLILIAGLLFSGIRTFKERQSGTPVTDFARTSFETFPEGATVFAEWSKFTPLVYFQRVHNLRPDVTVYERAYGPRQYQTGRVEDWRKFTYANAASRPVIIDLIDRAAPPAFTYNPMGHGWYQVVPLPPQD